MQRILLACLAAATLVIGSLALTDSTPPSSTRVRGAKATLCGGSVSGGSTTLQLAAARTGSETEPNGFGSFWKKLRKALKKIRDIIDQFLNSTNDGPANGGVSTSGSRFAFAGPEDTGTGGIRVWGAAGGLPGLG